MSNGRLSTLAFPSPTCAGASTVSGTLGRAEFVATDLYDRAANEEAFAGEFLNPLPRPTSAARAKVGPQGLSNDDAATAERDNRRPMGRR